LNGAKHQASLNHGIDENHPGADAEHEVNGLESARQLKVVEQGAHGGLKAKNDQNQTSPGTKACHSLAASVDPVGKAQQKDAEAA
jgi:hypothetical protein